MDHRPVYLDPRTGKLKLASHASSNARYWGTLEWDADNDQWTLRRRSRKSGKFDAVRSGRGCPDRASQAQLILDRMNATRASK